MLVPLAFVKLRAVEKKFVEVALVKVVVGMLTELLAPFRTMRPLPKFKVEVPMLRAVEVVRVVVRGA